MELDFNEGHGPFQTGNWEELSALEDIFVQPVSILTSNSSILTQLASFSLPKRRNLLTFCLLYRGMFLAP
jgi:hypothetical protein